VDAEPVAHDPRSAGKQGSFADAQCDAGDDESAEASDDAAGRLSDRPGEEAEGEQLARTVAVDEAADGKLRQSVGPEERGEQEAHFDNGDAEVVLDAFVGYRKGG